MFTGYQNAEELTQNLTDAGCSEAMIRCFLSYLHRGDKAGCICRLEERRAELLHKIHKEQSCLEILDSLISGLDE